MMQTYPRRHARASALMLSPRHALSARQHEPRVEIEHDAVGILALFRLQRQRGAIHVLDADEAHAQRADIAAARHLGLLQDFRPRVDGVARKRRCDVAAAVDGCQMEGVAEAVVGQRAHQRDDDAAVDDALAEAALGLGVLVEVHLGGVLVEARRGLMLGFLERHAIDMVDLFAGLIVAPAVRRAGKRQIVFRHVERSGRPRQVLRIDAVGKLRHDRFGRRRVLVALAHHHPAAILEHHLAVLIAAGRAHVDGAGLLVGVLLEPDDLGRRRQRIAGIDGLQEAAVGVAEVGDGIERDFRRRLAEHDVEGQQIVEGRTRIAEPLGENVRGLHGKARPVERRVERHIAVCDRARRGVSEDLAEAEILEKVASIRLRRCHSSRAPSHERRISHRRSIGGARQ